VWAELQSRVMSFDLFFCWDRQERINFEAVCSWSDALAYFERNDNQLWYRNEDTGVYFSLDFEGKQPAEGEGPEIRLFRYRTVVQSEFQSAQLFRLRSDAVRGESQQEIWPVCI